jgi:hypothetical protein
VELSDATSRSDRFTLGKTASSMRWEGGWVSPGAGPNMVASREFPAPGKNRTPVVKPHVFRCSEVRNL